MCIFCFDDSIVWDSFFLHLFRENNPESDTENDGICSAWLMDFFKERFEDSILCVDSFALRIEQSEYSAYLLRLLNGDI